MGKSGLEIVEVDAKLKNTISKEDIWMDKKIISFSYFLQNNSNITLISKVKNTIAKEDTWMDKKII